MNWKHLFTRKSPTATCTPLQTAVDGLTHIGRKRATNQDALLFQTEPGLIVVADGMGGHAGGEIAGNQAVRFFHRCALEAYDLGWRWPSTWGPAPDPGHSPLLQYILNKALMTAHDLINDLAQKDPSLHGMGTTFTAAVIADGECHWIHVGDSRLYLFRAGRLTQITVDQTFANLAQNHANRPIEPVELELFGEMLTQSVGGPQLTPVSGRFALEAGDQLLICSDGLHKMVGDSGISAVLTNIDGIRNQLEQLVLRANQNGGHDNISAVIATFS